MAPLPHFRVGVAVLGLLATACTTEGPSGRAELADEVAEGCEHTWPGGEAGVVGAAHAAPWGHDEDPGTAEAPYRSLERALRAVRGKRVPLVLLAEGTYAGGFQHPGPGPLHIQGACRDHVKIRVGGPEQEPRKPAGNVEVRGGTLRLSDLTVHGGTPGIRARDAGRLELRGVAIRWSREYGIHATNDAAVDLRGVTLSDIRRVGGSGRAVGLRGTNRSEVFSADLEVLRVEGHGVQLSGPGERSFDRLAISEGIGTPLWAAGVRASCGVLSLRGVRVDSQPGSGLSLAGYCGTGLRTTLEDVRTTAGRQRRYRNEGKGISLTGNIDAELRRIAVHRAQLTGIHIRDGRVSLRDVIVGDTRASLSLASGRGISVGGGASVRAEGIVSAGNAGVGLSVLAGARVRVAHGRFTGNRTAAVAVHSAHLEASDTLFEHTRPGPVLGGGFGLWLGTGGATAELTGCTFRDLSASGVYAHHFAALSIRGGLFEHNGRPGDLPGGVYAGQAWGTVAVHDSTFRDLSLDAILLEGVRAELSGNRFESIVGEPLRLQRCTKRTPVSTSGQPGVDPRCNRRWRETRPLMRYREGVEVDEVDVEDGE